MKKVILIRHAKSSWEFDVTDFNRPLNDKGLNDANMVSKALKLIQISPDLILSSDALRTITTCDIFISNLNFDKESVHLNHALYDFSGENLVKVIKSCDKNHDEIMIFGHNHAITAFVNSYGDEFIDNVPTCGVVIIEFDILNWEHLKRGKTIKTIFPRDFKL